MLIRVSIILDVGLCYQWRTEGGWGGESPRAELPKGAALPMGWRQKRHAK